METHLIHIEDFCIGHEIDITFITGLQQYDLIDLKLINKSLFIEIEELPKVEKMLRLHQDLNINIEGIDAIYHLLEQTNQMREEINQLRLRLKRLESL